MMASRTCCSLRNARKAPFWLPCYFRHASTSDTLPEASTYKTPLTLKSEKVDWPVYGGRHLVTLLPGSGIGPEMTQCVQEVFATAQVPVDFEVIDGTGEELVADAITSIRRNRIALKGNLVNVIDESGFIAPNVQLRTKLDLYVYVIHYRGYVNVRARVPGLNLILIRQNTEGEYAMLEHETVDGVVESMKIITRTNTERLAKFAFRHAQNYNRSKITVVHKSRDLKLADGLFLRTIKEVGADYPQIALEDIHIDRCCQQLVSSPDSFDVLLMPNLYGNIVSNIICGLAGGAGLYAGINYGEDIAVFEPATRHIGATLVGKNIANPVAMLNASTNMLRHLGKFDHAKLISEAIHKTLTKDRLFTPDVGGDCTTRQLLDNINEFIWKKLNKSLA